MIQSSAGGGDEDKGVVEPHEISCAHAVFAPIVSTSFTSALKYAPEDNFDLCSDLPKGYAKDHILVAERGVCPMLAKVEVASKAGAVGVDMVQNDEGYPSRMISHKLDRKEIPRVTKIPAVMISKANAEHLEHLRALANTGTTTGTTTTGISVTFMSSFGATDQVGEEARSWDQIRSAKGSAAKAAVRHCLLPILQGITDGSNLATTRPPNNPTTQPHQGVHGNGLEVCARRVEGRQHTDKQGRRAVDSQAVRLDRA